MIISSVRSDISRILSNGHSVTASGVAILARCNVLTFVTGSLQRQTMSLLTELKTFSHRYYKYAAPTALRVQAFRFAITTLSATIGANGSSQRYLNAILKTIACSHG